MKYLLKALAIISIFASFSLCLIYGQIPNGEREYEEKNVTVTIQSGELVYCFFGNSSKSTVVCDKVDADMGPKAWKALDKAIEDTFK